MMKSERTNPGQNVPTEQHTHLQEGVLRIPVEAAISKLHEALPGYPAIARILGAFLRDEDHPLNIAIALRDPSKQATVLHEIREILRFRAISEQEFRQIVNLCAPEGHYVFVENSNLFFLVNSKGHPTALRDILLERERLLYAIDGNPDKRQMEALRKYTAKLNLHIMRNLQSVLRTLAGEIKADGYPLINARAKSAQGILEKIERMRTGNKGKEPRPNYCLADMPDAVGGRITVTLKDHEKLGRMMEQIEDYYKGRIAEKDSFYINPLKKYNSYRVVTYTVLVDQVPCEVQLTTLSASIAADICHNTVYKDIITVREEERREIEEFSRRATARELEVLCKRGTL